MDFKRTKLAVLITALIASGCSASKLDANNNAATVANGSQEYCRNGGNSSDYSCDTQAQGKAADTTETVNNPNTEAWMNSKLSDIKSWLKTIKENPDSAIGKSTPSTKALQVRNPAATHPELVRIEAMTQRGDYRNAMAAINIFLAANPDNLEAELTKGLVLNNMGEVKEAEALLRNAIARNPTSPELYNNLAVIYSDQGDYGKAIETLLLAFSTHPSYAQVNENLREVYSSVASLAYNRALDLDSTNKQTPNLIVLRRISSPSLPAVAHASLSIGIASNKPTKIASSKPASSAEPKPAKILSKPIVVAARKQVALPIPKIIDPEPEVAIAKLVIKPAKKAPAVKQSIVRVDTNNTTKTAKAQGSSTAAAIKAVNRWSWTWSTQNVNAYLGSYVVGYKPKITVSHTQWRKLRTSRLTKPAFIKVKLSNIKSTRISNGVVEVTFLQKYQANTYKDQSKKKLTLKKVGAKWLIVKEQNI
ncbi:MAG: tetratricopeptide repeat protein [Pseudomonadales bacterium]|nr:tetratricopeptide repeat protein [Pseudomonadales bacterium]